MKTLTPAKPGRMTRSVNTPKTSGVFSIQKPSYRTRKLMIPCGTPRKSKWCSPVGCMAIYECIGPRRSSNGVRLPQLLTISPCDSMIATNSMVVIPMATPASPGRSLESTIVPGDRSDQYTVKSVTCPIKARRGNLTTRLTLSESRCWKEIAQGQARFASPNLNEGELLFLLPRSCCKNCEPLRQTDSDHR